MDEGKRFESDSEHDPEVLFPSFMAELRLRYPDYRVTFDRRTQKWLVYDQKGPSCVMSVAFCEYADGTPAPLSMEFLDKLTFCDVIRRYGTPEAYLDWLERESERQYEEGIQRMLEEMRYARRPILRWLEGGGRETIMLRPFPTEHRRQLDRDLALSVVGTASSTTMKEAS